MNEQKKQGLVGKWRGDIKHPRADNLVILTKVGCADELTERIQQLREAVNGLRGVQITTRPQSQAKTGYYVPRDAVLAAIEEILG